MTSLRVQGNVNAEHEHLKKATHALSRQGVAAPDPLKAFSLLLLALNSTPALNPSGVGGRFRQAAVEDGFGPALSVARSAISYDACSVGFMRRASRICMEGVLPDQDSSVSSREARIRPPRLWVPDSGEDMVLQCRAAVERAFAAGLVRQTVRLARVPPDDAVGGVTSQLWSGTPQIMYERGLLPNAQDLLRRLRANKKQEPSDRKTLTRFAEVTTRNLSDWEGCGVAEAQPRDGDPNGKVFAAIGFDPDARYLDELESLDARAGPDRLLLLVNPKWKDRDSWSFDLFQPRAKQRAAAAIFDRPPETCYETTYWISRFYEVRERFVVCIKAFPYDWEIFAYHREEDSEYYGITPVHIGSTPELPKRIEVLRLIDAHPEFRGLGGT